MGELTTQSVTPQELALQARTDAFLAQVEQASDRQRDEDVAGATVRAFAQDWKLWEEFIESQNSGRGLRLTTADVTPGMLDAFVSWLDQTKQAAPTSIRRRITGVKANALSVHGIALTRDDLAKARATTRRLTAASGKTGSRESEVQKAARAERLARMRGQAEIVTPDMLLSMATLPAEKPMDLRDRAMACLSFGIAARVAETAALSVADIRFVPGSGLQVEVPPVKGSAGRTVAVPFSRVPERCPVRTWLAWKEAGNLKEGGAAFPAFGRAGSPLDRYLSAESCRNALNNLGRRAFSPDPLPEDWDRSQGVNVTGHSFRRGYITAARAAGTPVERIARQSGHSLKSASFWLYIDLADLWDNPTALL